MWERGDDLHHDLSVFALACVANRSMLSREESWYSRRHRPPQPSALDHEALGGGSVERVVRRLSSALDEVLRSPSDVPGDLAEQYRGQIPSPMVRHRGPSSIGVPELTVRSTRANLDRTKCFEDRNHLARFENWQAAMACLNA